MQAAVQMAQPLRPIPLPPLDHRPASARRRVLDAARSLLVQNGYDRFTMEAVAARAGLSRRTLYNQFEDRDALYRASRLELIDGFEALLPTELNPEAELRRGIERFFAAALAALTLPDHRELLASVERDAGVLWLKPLYAARVERPLRLAVEHYLLMQKASGRLELADPAPAARRALAMLRAALSVPDAAPVFEAGELAALFVQRLAAQPQ